MGGNKKYQRDPRLLVNFCRLLCTMQHTKTKKKVNFHFVFEKFVYPEWANIYKIFGVFLSVCVWTQYYGSWILHQYSGRDIQTIEVLMQFSNPKCQSLISLYPPCRNTVWKQWGGTRHRGRPSQGGGIDEESKECCGRGPPKSCIGHLTEGS